MTELIRGVGGKGIISLHGCSAEKLHSYYYYYYKKKPLSC
jgi:hypothetical protein